MISTQGKAITMSNAQKIALEIEREYELKLWWDNWRLAFADATSLKLSPFSAAPKKSKRKAKR